MKWIWDRKDRSTLVDSHKDICEWKKGGPSRLGFEGLNDSRFALCMAFASFSSGNRRSVRGCMFSVYLFRVRGDVTKMIMERYTDIGCCKKGINIVMDHHMKKRRRHQHAESLTRIQSVHSLLFQMKNWYLPAPPPLDKKKRNMYWCFIHPYMYTYPESSIRLILTPRRLRSLGLPLTYLLRCCLACSSQAG